MLRLFHLLTQCKDRAERAIAQSESDGATYREAIDKNLEAHRALMEKIDRRGAKRKMSAA